MSQAIDPTAAETANAEPGFDAEVDAHDARLVALGLVVWVGSEPTFTDRHAQSPEWLRVALGGDKEAVAARLIAGLSCRSAGGVVLRSEGRHYPGETEPRWNIGHYRRRDGLSLWNGPPDPIEGRSEPGAGEPPSPDRLAAALSTHLAHVGFRSGPSSADAGPERCTVAVEQGDGVTLLFTLGIEQLDGQPTARIALPPLATVAAFLQVLQAIERAAGDCALPSLVLAGCTPPVDASVELITATPDPAVIEFNTAPSVDAADFLRRSREIYAAAAAQGLAPYRLHFNGAVADSGGGGQITLGGESPLQSPFLQVPQLLPRLVRFFNRHPSLSYNYSHDFVGSSGQSARADERGADAFNELALGLHLLSQQPDPQPEMLWRSLDPFLCDAVGNSHRAEINIEKLWNPHLGPRGLQGLVEFRALRMQQTPERATALACLLRAIVAMLATQGDELPLIDWGDELHERFALPYYLEQDLLQVLAALQAAGLGLGPALRSVLLREEFRRWGEVSLPGCTLDIRRALEFWPLVGDATSPHQGGTSRLVDSSTARVELRLRQDPSCPGWQLLAAGRPLPMRQERDAQGTLSVYGLRYRCFTPHLGLHPTLGSQAPLRLRLRHPDQPHDHCVTLHEWRPDGEAYEGLPTSLDDARRRRSERVSVEAVARGDVTAATSESALRPGAYAMDLRWLGGPIPI
jgi:uncharacterized protein (DUF2126 family)